MNSRTRSKNKIKFIFVTGGVLSSLGKGIAAASIGALLESAGLKVTLMKLDPYINDDPGTMNPFQHGEVYVTDDGAETDLDLGHYERFTHAKMRRSNNVTAGRIYHEVIQKERRGEFRESTEECGFCAEIVDLGFVIAGNPSCCCKNVLVARRFVSLSQLSKMAPGRFWVP